MQVDGVSTRIVGVMPRGFDVHDQRVELWQPITIDPAHPGGRGSHSLYLIGRLKDGVTLAQARDDLDRMLREWKTIAPNTHVPNPTTHRLRYDPLKDDIIRHVATALWILLGAVGFVLLIACANIANLLLARSRVAAARAGRAHGARRAPRPAAAAVPDREPRARLAGGALGVLLAWWLPPARRHEPRQHPAHRPDGARRARAGVRARAVGRSPGCCSASRPSCT